MALVAYSDDSDLGTDSEPEEGDGGGGGVADRLIEGKHPLGPSTKVTSPGRVESGVDSIEDEEEEEDNPKSESSSSGLFSSVPAPVPVSDLLGEAGVEEEDEVVDVPTVETWKVTQELKKQNTQTETQLPRKEKKKVKIFLPSMSEFADDDDDDLEEEKEKPRKKVKSSSSGSGLFSVLPEPKYQSAKESGRSLVPHVLTKRPSQPQKLKKKASLPPVRAAAAVGHGSDDDDDDDDVATAGTDFFSLSEPTVVDHIRIVEEPNSNPVATATAPNVKPIQEPPRVPCSQPMESMPVNQKQYQDYEEEGPSNIVLNMSEPMESTTVPAAASGGIDEAALLRLAGKRGRAEAINFINVNADDALLTRDEWMTKTLSEEKPQHGFSKKREGLPTQKQKQKHQITYLAHQAKERELDLKNSWAQNRMTKMQSQAKYGF